MIKPHVDQDTSLEYRRGLYGKAIEGLRKKLFPHSVLEPQILLRSIILIENDHSETIYVPIGRYRNDLPIGT